MVKFVSINEVAKKFSKSFNNAYVVIGQTYDYMTIVFNKRGELTHKDYSFEYIKRKYKADKITLGRVNYRNENTMEEIKGEEIITLFYNDTENQVEK